MSSLDDYWREVAQILDAHDLSAMPPQAVRGMLRGYLAAESGDADLCPVIRWCPTCREAVAGITESEAEHFALNHCSPEREAAPRKAPMAQSAQGGGGWSARHRVEAPTLRKSDSAAGQP